MGDDKVRDGGDHRLYENRRGGVVHGAGEEEWNEGWNVGLDVWKVFGNERHENILDEKDNGFRNRRRKQVLQNTNEMRYDGLFGE